MAVGQFDVKWTDFGREAVHPSNPEFPGGVDLVLAQAGQPTCKVDLPYPAARCGAYTATCRICGLRAAITTAGRPDDPRSAVLPCRPMARA